MTMNSINKTEPKHSNTPTLTQVCLASCRKLLAQIEKTKDTIVTEFRESVGASEHLLHLALIEAETLAWQTEYPHLVFPTLALEKAQGVAAWHARQRSIRQATSGLVAAAGFKSALSAEPRTPTFRSMTPTLIIRLAASVLVLAAVIVLSTGCGRSDAKPQLPPPPSVTVEPVEQKEIVEWDEFTGRIEPIET